MALTAFWDLKVSSVFLNVVESSFSACQICMCSGTGWNVAIQDVLRVPVRTSVASGKLLKYLCVHVHARAHTYTHTHINNVDGSRHFWITLYKCSEQCQWTCQGQIPLMRGQLKVKLIVTRRLESVYVASGLFIVKHVQEFIELIAYTNTGSKRGTLV
jgi:hypothetical protein